jgi:hypothetical protein
MSNSRLSSMARDLWEREWAKAAQMRGSINHHAMMQTCPSPAMLDSLVELVAEDPSRPTHELEPVIHRMLFESQFIDDGGDSVILDAFDCIDEQTRILIKILEEVRQVGVGDGIWSTTPMAPMMFG